MARPPSSIVYSLLIVEINWLIIHVFHEIVIILVILALIVHQSADVGASLGSLGPRIFSLRQGHHRLL